MADAPIVVAMVTRFTDLDSNTFANYFVVSLFLHGVTPFWV